MMNSYILVDEIEIRRLLGTYYHRLYDFFAQLIYIGGYDRKIIASDRAFIAYLAFKDLFVLKGVISSNDDFISANSICDHRAVGGKGIDNNSRILIVDDVMYPDSRVEELYKKLKHICPSSKIDIDAFMCSEELKPSGSFWNSVNSGVLSMPFNNKPFYFNEECIQLEESVSTLVKSIQLNKILPIVPPEYVSLKGDKDLVAIPNTRLSDYFQRKEYADVSYEGAVLYDISCRGEIASYYFANIPMVDNNKFKTLTQSNSNEESIFAYQNMTIKKSERMSGRQYCSMSTVYKKEFRFTLKKIDEIISASKVSASSIKGFMCPEETLWDDILAKYDFEKPDSFDAKKLVEEYISQARCLSLNDGISIHRFLGMLYNHLSSSSEITTNVKELIGYLWSLCNSGYIYIKASLYRDDSGNEYIDNAIFLNRLASCISMEQTEAESEFKEVVCVLPCAPLSLA